MRVLTLPLVLWSVSPAFAAEVVGRVVVLSAVEIGGRLSTTSTEASTNSSRSATPTAECADSTDCHSEYRCQAGRCMGGPEVGSSTRAGTPSPCSEGQVCVEAAEVLQQCEQDSGCQPGQRCLNGSCEVRPPARSGPTVNCAGSSECSAGEVCSEGICLYKPSSSLRRQALELYMRTRSVELREELGLGQGPVIKGLARVQGVSAKKLGRTLRQHQAELAALIGDASGADWAGRLLTRVEELCAHI